jgi:hypothetical protein
MFGKRWHKGELPAPPDAVEDPDGFEIARVWGAFGRQHVSLNVGIWEDMRAWGIALVDLAQHVADACHQIDGRSKEEVLAKIREGFEAEWQNSTSRVQGRILDETGDA